MSAPPVSVVIVSRGRAADLPLCLLGVSQLNYPKFEIVLVADRAGLSAARDLPFFDQLKTVPFEQANISAARNMGVVEAAGEIIAFIDDDAVPEPTWLTHLVAGFDDPSVGVAGGFVRGRNGISFQWTARSVDGAGKAARLDVDGARISVLSPSNGRAIKTEGTNMAVRRDVLADIGGFDPAYRFYLDETDVNLRLGTLGVKTAIAPLAQVHHGYKASTTRRADRVPLDLFEIGASQMVFLRKHAPVCAHQQVLDAFRSEQRRRVLQHMVHGRLEPRDIRRLLRGLEDGIEDGKHRAVPPLAKLPHARVGFEEFRGTVSGHVVLSGRVWHRGRVLDRAAQLVQCGTRATAIILSPTARPMTVRFTTDGVWYHQGGVFGRSERKGVRVKLANFRVKLAQELKRIDILRGKSAN